MLGKIYFWHVLSKSMYISLITAWYQSKQFVHFCPSSLCTSVRVPVGVSVGLPVCEWVWVRDCNYDFCWRFLGVVFRVWPRYVCVCVCVCSRVCGRIYVCVTDFQPGFLGILFTLCRWEHSQWCLEQVTHLSSEPWPRNNRHTGKTCCNIQWNVYHGIQHRNSPSNHRYSRIWIIHYPTS